ncbi:MAG TPA: FAD-binding oxidoreductase [Gaiella sp.]|nr:FAD-binding oxidoreductase [Gaiella sp.]
MTQAETSIADSVDELRRSLEGDVVVPGDVQYDAARLCFNAFVDRRPTAIVRCLGRADVATAFDFARRNDLEIAVRGGGHNPAGHCVLDGGLVIDLSRMRRVDVDPEDRVARAEGGSTWLDFDTATVPHGLVTPGGVVGSTGVCGLALGGGIGHLTAQHGLTCDNIVAAELVTSDGSTVRASADENPELLWALRGGGGNFGVVTRLELRLHALQPVIGGRLRYRGPVGDVLRGFREIVADAPRDASCQAVLVLDESLEPAVVVFPCVTGSEHGHPMLDALRAVPGLVEDGVRSHSFVAQQSLFGTGYGVDRHYWKGHFVRGLPDELIDELVRRISALGRPPGEILLESLHGAPKDPDAPPGAIGYRQAAFNVSATATWRDPGLDDEHVAWSRETAAAIEPWSWSGGGYANYMQADEPLERIRAMFAEGAFDRLQALKRRYDPDNVLRRNQNIPPGE